MVSGTGSRPAVPAAVHLMVQVWGDFYTGTLIDFCIPALLSSRNLPALAAMVPCRFDIYTTPIDEARIRSAPILRRLVRFADVRFFRLEIDASRDKYALMTACNIQALREAWTHSAAVVFLVPDTIWSDGTLETIARALAAGKRAVMQTGVRVVADTAIPALLARCKPDENGALTVPPRELVRIAFDHMHPFFRTWFWDEPEFNRNPAHSYWRVNEYGLIARCFHLHPLMIYCDRPVFDFVSTLDDDLPVVALPDFSAFYIVDDSDEIFHIDLAHRDILPTFRTLPGGPTPDYLAEWARFTANVHHRRFADHPIRFHAEPFDSRWSVRERDSERVIASVRRQLAKGRMPLRLMSLVLGVDAAAVVDRAAARRLGWDSCPPTPWWWTAATAVGRRASDGLAERMQQYRADVFVRVVQDVFGINVAAKALALDVKAFRRVRFDRFKPVAEQRQRRRPAPPNLGTRVVHLSVAQLKALRRTMHVAAAEKRHLVKRIARARRRAAHRVESLRKSLRRRMRGASRYLWHGRMRPSRKPDQTSTSERL
jgi:hypothetical protein